MTAPAWLHRRPNINYRQRRFVIEANVNTDIDPWILAQMIQNYLSQHQDPRDLRKVGLVWPEIDDW